MFDADRIVFYGFKQCLTGKNNGKSQDRSQKGAERPSYDGDFDGSPARGGSSTPALR